SGLPENLSVSLRSYLLDQRHRLSIATVYEPNLGRRFCSSLLRTTFSGWKLSSVVHFASGRPFAALVDTACTTADTGFGDCLDTNLANGPASNSISNMAASQSTANSALGINAGRQPLHRPEFLLRPWRQQIDLGLARRFRISERQSETFQVQAFNSAQPAA